MRVPSVPFGRCLIVVVGIIGLLAAVAIPNLVKAAEDAFGPVDITLMTTSAR